MRILSKTAVTSKTMRYTFDSRQDAEDFQSVMTWTELVTEVGEIVDNGMVTLFPGTNHSQQYNEFQIDITK